MFHDAFMKTFRSQRIYVGDFPDEHVETPYELLGLPKFDAEKYVEKVDVEQKGTASRHVMTVRTEEGSQSTGRCSLSVVI